MIQFGLATIYFDSEAVGYVQGGSLDFAFDKAQLYDGSGKFPIDVRTHTGRVSGSGKFAQLEAESFYKILGGTLEDINQTHRQIITTSSEPPEIQLQFEVTTDSLTLRITLLKVISGQLSMEFARDGYIIPDFNFEAFADDDGDVAYVDLVGATDPIS